LRAKVRVCEQVIVRKNDKLIYDSSGFLFLWRIRKWFGNVVGKGG
jgi:hypothetical protein